MIKGMPGEEVIHRFILGDLPEVERSSIEERCLADDEFFALILAAEDELIDDYVRGGLEAEERKKFERHFLQSPRYRQRVAFARSLAVGRPAAGIAPEVSVERSRAGGGVSSWWEALTSLFDLRNPALGYGLAATLLLLVGGVALMLRQGPGTAPSVATLKGRPEPTPSPTAPPTAPGDSAHGGTEPRVGEGTAPAPQPGGAQTANSQPREGGGRSRPENQAPGEVQQPRKEPPPSIVATFALAAGMVRSAAGVPASNKLVIGAGVRQIRLELETEETYENYRAVVQTLDGTEVFRQDDPPARRSPSGAKVTVSVPARVLKDGNYVLKLEGVGAAGASEEADRFAFSVTTRR